MLSFSHHLSPTRFCHVITPPLLHSWCDVMLLALPHAKHMMLGVASHLMSHLAKHASCMPGGGVCAVDMWQRSIRCSHGMYKGSMYFRRRSSDPRSEACETRRYAKRATAAMRRSPVCSQQDEVQKGESLNLATQGYAAKVPDLIAFFGCCKVELGCS